MKPGLLKSPFPRLDECRSFSIEFRPMGRAQKGQVLRDCNKMSGLVRSRKGDLSLPGRRTPHLYEKITVQIPISTKSTQDGGKEFLTSIYVAEKNYFYDLANKSTKWTFCTKGLLLIHEWMEVSLRYNSQGTDRRLAPQSVNQGNQLQFDSYYPDLHKLFSRSAKESCRRLIGDCDNWTGD